MSLFKIYRGTEAELPKTYHEGYAYFTTDEGNLYIDIASSADFTTGTRVQVNAGTADTAGSAGALDDGVTHIDIDDVALKSQIIDVTDLGALTVNAILVGNGSNKVKLVPTSNGAFFANEANGVPQFGVLPTSLGGTGATDAAGARGELNVYSKEESKKLSPVAYTFTIPASGWSGSGPYTYSYENTDIKCGLAGNVHPLITPTDDTVSTEQWSKVSKAVATVGTGIVFTCNTYKPEADLNLTVIDYVG